MTDTPSAELKPCPFCGCDAEKEGGGGQYTVWCPNLNHKGVAEVYGKTEAEAITAWNTRAQSEVERVLLAALKVAHEFITNGIELGYIRMPSPGTPDGAIKTPEIVRAAITRATGGGA